MAQIFLSSKDQGIVVFKVWKSLQYKLRILISLSCIFVGFLIQYFSVEIFPGVVFILLGNILLLPSGYDNRIKPGKYSPKAEWEKVGQNKLTEFLKFDRKMRKWDVSVIDVSNFLGGLTLLIILVIIGYFSWEALVNNNKIFGIIAADGLILIVPFWITGMRSIFTVPNLTMKSKIVLGLLYLVRMELTEHKIDYYFLLRGEDTKIPQDVKFKVNIKNQDRDFLGFYGQIVTNNVGSMVYPYFYVVLVAKRNFGLREAYEQYFPNRKITKEFKVEEDVEVFVIRQNTNISAGYHTKTKSIKNIFLEGLRIAERVAVKKV